RNDARSRCDPARPRKRRWSFPSPNGLEGASATAGPLQIWELEPSRLPRRPFSRKLWRTCRAPVTLRPAPAPNANHASWLSASLGHFSRLRHKSEKPPRIIVENRMHGLFLHTRLNQFRSKHGLRPAV